MCRLACSSGSSPERERVEQVEGLRLPLLLRLRRDHLLYRLREQACLALQPPDLASLDGGRPERAVLIKRLVPTVELTRYLGVVDRHRTSACTTCTTCTTCTRTRTTFGLLLLLLLRRGRGRGRLLFDGHVQPAHRSRRRRWHKAPAATTASTASSTAEATTGSTRHGGRSCGRCSWHRRPHCGCRRHRHCWRGRRAPLEHPAPAAARRLHRRAERRRVHRQIVELCSHLHRLLSHAQAHLEHLLLLHPHPLPLRLRLRRLELRLLQLGLLLRIDPLLERLHVPLHRIELLRRRVPLRRRVRARGAV